MDDRAPPYFHEFVRRPSRTVDEPWNRTSPFALVHNVRFTSARTWIRLLVVFGAFLLVALSVLLIFANASENVTGWRLAAMFTAGVTLPGMVGAYMAMRRPQLSVPQRRPSWEKVETATVLCTAAAWVKQLPPSRRSKRLSLLQCSVCLEDILACEVVRGLKPCGHAFHRSCIDPWLLYNPDKSRLVACPVCRTPVDLGFQNYRAMDLQRRNTTGDLLGAGFPSSPLQGLASRGGLGLTPARVTPRHTAPGAFVSPPTSDTGLPPSPRDAVDWPDELPRESVESVESVPTDLPGSLQEPEAPASGSATHEAEHETEQNGRGGVPEWPEPD